MVSEPRCSFPLNQFIRQFFSSFQFSATQLLKDITKISASQTKGLLSSQDLWEILTNGYGKASAEEVKNNAKQKLALKDQLKKDS